MAGESDVQQDMQAHAETYSSFLSLLKKGAIASFILGFIVVLIIAK